MAYFSGSIAAVMLDAGIKQAVLQNGLGSQSNHKGFGVA